MQTLIYDIIVYVIILFFSVQVVEERIFLLSISLVIENVAWDVGITFVL
jgi:hypothetical protein